MREGQELHILVNGVINMKG